MSTPAGQRYAGRVVLVTGGGSGIGEACCRRLAAEGARLAILDVDAAAAERVGAALQASGSDVHVLACDVSDATATERAIKTAAAQLGRIDVAVNNAGIAGVLTPISDYPPETWNQVLGVNLSGVFHCMRAELPLLVQQGGGVIINMASILGTVGFAGAAAYVAAKHGVIGLTRTAALEYGPAKVRVNAVCPSFIQTPLTLGPLPDGATWEALSALHPLQRCAQPEEIASVVAFLGSDDARYMNGAVQIVDGGYTAG